MRDEVGEELGRVEGGGTVIRIYYGGDLFSIKGKKSGKYVEHKL